jgi:uncharacterized protein
VVASLPLFPLSTVLMPGASLPLHIFEPRYRQLTVDLVTGVVPDKQFGIVAVREGWIAGDDPGDEAGGLHRVGCTAELLDARRLPDGRFDIVTRGVRRFRLVQVDAEARPYLTGEVEYVPDEPASAPDDLPALATAARAAHRRYCITAWKSGEWSEPADEVGSAELAHLLAADDPGTADPGGGAPAPAARRPGPDAHLLGGAQRELTGSGRSAPGGASPAFRHGESRVSTRRVLRSTRRVPRSTRRVPRPAAQLQP